jgi:hypothetical protein
VALNVLTDAFRQGQFDASTAGLPVNFATDSLAFLLVTQAGDSVADVTKRSYIFETAVGNEIGAGSGYNTRGVVPGGQSVTQAASVVSLTSANPTWSTATITAYGGWLYKYLATAATSPLIGYYTFGAAIISTAGTFTVQISASGWISVSGG